jgi:ABC-type phosphate/phosphonate transport system substrate-binding protein
MPAIEKHSVQGRDETFISCGMYSFTTSLQTAWQKIFDEFFEIENASSIIKTKVLDVSNFDILTDSNLLIGHTCGYPLMKTYLPYLAPLCVPMFKVPGVNQRHYCSFFITGKYNPINNLTDCANKIAAINGHDSNSGMNVLRHAITPLASRSCYFSEVIVTGGHWDSVIAVSESRADIAAIDCVTFALLKDHVPELIDSIKIIGESAETCGLPFVIPLANDSEATRKKLVQSLNTALERVDDVTKSNLHLDRFEMVKILDYEYILDIENESKQQGYPILC